MLSDPIADIHNALDRSLWALRYRGEIVAQNADFSVNLKTVDGILVPSVGWCGGVVQIVTQGQRVVYAFDSRGVIQIIGTDFVGVGAEFAVLGAQLLAALNALVLSYNTHTHTNSSGATSVPVTLASSVTSSILSGSVVVQK